MIESSVMHVIAYSNLSPLVRARCGNPVPYWQRIDAYREGLLDSVPSDLN